jgi:chaperonin GroEL
MPTPKVIQQPESAQHLKVGFDKMADLLAVTLGPTQGVVFNQSTTRNRPELLNDAATIARRVVALPDRREDVGAMLLRHLVWQVHRRVGDGGASTAVLAQAILDEGARMVVSGAHATRVQHGIETAAAQAEQALLKLARPVSGQEDLAAVAAAITAEEKISWVLGEMFDILGSRAYITVENFVAPYLERTYIEGGRWSGQIASPMLYTSAALRQAQRKDCWVVAYDGSLQDMDLLRPLMEVISEQDPPTLLLVANELSGTAVDLLVRMHHHPKSKIRIVAAGLKIGGDQGRQELIDLALLTGATVLGEGQGRALSSVKASDLGQAGRVQVTADSIFVTHGKGDARAVRTEVESIHRQILALPEGDDALETLQSRQARLNGSAGVLKIGALTKPERDVQHQQAEQGIKALRAALDGGVLPGGGMALIRAGQAIDPNTAEGPDERMGQIAMKNALKAPFFRILANAQESAPALKLQDVLAAGPDHVYDVRRASIVPASEYGLLDAASVIQHVLKTAVSGAVMALSVDVTVLKSRPVTNVNYDP